MDSSVRDYGLWGFMIDVNLEASLHCGSLCQVVAPLSVVLKEVSTHKWGGQLPRGLYTPPFPSLRYIYFC